MKKYPILLVCLVLFFTTGSVFAQQAQRSPQGAGHQGPQVTPSPQKPSDHNGFTGPQRPANPPAAPQRPANPPAAPQRPANPPVLVTPQRPANPPAAPHVTPAPQRYPVPSLQIFITPLRSINFGFTGPAHVVPVLHAQYLPNRTPVIIRGNLVFSMGQDLYILRDSSGDIIVRITQRDWQQFGSNIGPYDIIEIFGEVYLDQWDPQRAPEVNVIYIKKL